MTYDLAPKPGMNSEQRREELTKAGWSQVRALAYQIYKRPDGSPLMTYIETLDDRERVKTEIINHEVNLGLVNMSAETTNLPTHFQESQPASPAQAAMVPETPVVDTPEEQLVPPPKRKPGRPRKDPLAAPVTSSADVLLEKVNLLGRGLEIVASNSDLALKEIIAVKEQLLRLEVMLHHVYLSTTDPKAPQSLPEFRQHMKKFYTNVPT